LIDWQYFIDQKIDLGINEFYFIKEVPLKYFLAFILSEKID